MPRASDLIKAHQEGATFERILHAVRTNRTAVSSLPEEKLDLLEMSVPELQRLATEMSEALSRDDLPKLRELSIAVEEFALMIKDTCGDG